MNRALETSGGAPKVGPVKCLTFKIFRTDTIDQYRQIYKEKDSMFYAHTVTYWANKATKI